LGPLAVFAYAGKSWDQDVELESVLISFLHTDIPFDITHA